MKRCLVLIAVILTALVITPAFGQHRYSFIDQKVRDLAAPSPDSLAKLLTHDLYLEVDKVRAIYSWIAQNISYNTGVFSTGRRPSPLPIIYEEEDTSVNWSSAIEMTARRVLKKRTAICDGYAKLFHTLCKYAGIRSEIVLGYARSGYERESRFRTNHSWNAVMIDSAWQLVDVTWGSGYVSSGAAFIRQPDDKYFLPSPEQFINDHYPEDLFWTLLKDPPAPGEYRRSPFRLKNYIKYNINSHFPGKGIIEAAQGDSLVFTVELKDLKKAGSISPDPFFDSTIFSRSDKAVFIEPFLASGNRLYYKFIAAQLDLQWIYLVFNQDLILRYRVNTSRQLVATN